MFFQINKLKPREIILNKAEIFIYIWPYHMLTWSFTAVKGGAGEEGSVYGKAEIAGG